MKSDQYQRCGTAKTYVPDGQVKDEENRKAESTLLSAYIRSICPKPKKPAVSPRTRYAEVRTRRKAPKPRAAKKGEAIDRICKSVLTKRPFPTNGRHPIQVKDAAKKTLDET